jgi:hypothetical protein
MGVDLGALGPRDDARLLRSRDSEDFVAMSPLLRNSPVKDERQVSKTTQGVSRGDGAHVSRVFADGPNDL